jgi:heme/copper-type cytochrome/quinol oxidase subunit 2
LTSQSAPRHTVIHWNTLKGSIAIIVFLAVAVLTEFLVVLYAMDLGIKDVGELTTNWPVTITISPLFHLVPIAVIITLSFTWIYLTKKLSVRPVQPIGRVAMRQPTSKKSQPAKSSLEKTEPSPPRVKGFSYIWQKIYSARATIKSALIIFLAFAILMLIVSQLAYPGVIYQTLTSSYQSHSSAYDFVISVANSLSGFARTVSPIGWIATAINNGLVALSPGVRAVGMAFGSLIAPLANLDPAGKYLAFQNAAAWISVLLVLLYGQYARRSYRYRKK